VSSNVPPTLGATTQSKRSSVNAVTTRAWCARRTRNSALLAELLSIPSGAADQNLSPQRKRERLFEAEFHQFEALARRRPLLIVVEDAHCIDPTTREPEDAPST
jgi:predicted ATPase